MKAQKSNLAFFKKISPLLGALILIPSLLFNFYLYRENQKLESVYLVEKVIDGDSLVLKNDQSIRLGNLYAPELEFCGGQQAKERLEELVLNKIVRLEVFSHDQFNRPLALVYINNTLVNEVLLKEGWGRYDGTPSPQRDLLKKAYDDALENKKGIFGSLCVQEKPEKENCLIKGNIDRNNNKKTYHFPGCSEYERSMVEKDLGESWFCSEKEAQKAGFAKATNCFGRDYKP